MTLDESVHGMRLLVIERAQVQGNVSAVCRELGISRPTAGTLWGRRRAPAPAARPGGASGGDGARCVLSFS